MAARRPDQLDLYCTEQPRCSSWVTSFAQIIHNLDTDAFSEALIEVFNSIAPFESNLILMLRHEAPPVVLHEALNTLEHDLFYECYLKGGYLLSPYYQGWRRGHGTGFYRMNDVAPENFEQSVVYRNYYLHTGLLDELGYLIALDENFAILLWLGICSRPYTDQELAVFRFLEPLVTACARQHWRQMPEYLTGTSNRDRLFHQRFEEWLTAFGTYLLTDREAEIVQLLLKGYASKSICEKLNVAPGTVKNHCNNIYEKLDVTTRAELFSLFIQSISQLDLNSRGDPLQSYMSRPRHPEQ